MNLRQLSSICLGVGIVLTAWLAYARAGGVKQDEALGVRPASARHLSSADGVTLVEVTEATYSATSDNLNGYACRVKNVSGKDLTALGLVWTTTFSNNRAVQTFQSIDSRVHEDIVKFKGLRPIAPNEERAFRASSRESFSPDLPIKSVEVKVEFAEFAGAEAAGAEHSKLYRQLLQERRGASLYKKWLMNVYASNPRNLKLVAAKLSSEELPADESLKDAGVKHGANIYRQWLQDVYTHDGADSVQKILGQD